MPKEFVLINE